MNEKSNVVRPSLILDNIPEELRFSPERHARIRRFIDEYVYSPEFKEESSGFDELSEEDKEIVTKWANRIHERALNFAPSITNCLLRMLDPGVELLGYRFENGTIFHKEDNHTVKSINSLKRKIIADATLDYNGDYNEAGANIRDGLRYTIIIPREIYLEKVDEYLHKLEDMGFGPIDAKNHWVDHDKFWSPENKAKWPTLRYQGINAKIKLPNVDDVFEIQFHYPMEHQIKEGSTRDLYNAYRAVDLKYKTGDFDSDDLEVDWRRELQIFRMLLQFTIIPPDTPLLKACDYRFVSRVNRADEDSKRR